MENKIFKKQRYQQKNSSAVFWFMVKCIVVYAMGMDQTIIWVGEPS